MIPEEKTDNDGEKELINLLYQMTKTDEGTTTTTAAAENNQSEIIIVDDNSVVEEGEIIALDNDDDDDDEQKKEVEDGEITESQESDDDDVEELNLRLTALRSLAGAKKHKRQKTKKVRPKRRRSPDTRRRYLHDDIDLRSTIRNRSSSRHSNHEDREYLLDKDYRQPSVFDRLLSLMSPNHNKKLVDNYDIQQMDIVDDYPIPPPLPPLPPLPPPLPPSHLPFFDPLPPLPPPPPMIFNMFPVNQSVPMVDWPRPNFVPQVQADVWQPTFNNSTDVDLRLQPMSVHHHSMISPRMNEPLFQKKPSQTRRKRSKKRHDKRKIDSSLPSIPIPIERPSSPPPPPPSEIVDEDDEEEHLLREQLLRTLSTKRKVKIIEPPTPEPDRIVTIVPPNSPPLPPPPLTVSIVQTPPVVNKSVDVPSKSQYSINQRYKRVKASVSATNLASKTETVTTTTTTTVVRTTQPIIQTRNKIVRVPETDIDMPQSTPIIVTFDEPTSDEEEHQIHQGTNQSSYPIADEERQAIKRAQQIQDDVIHRSNTTESLTKTVPPKVPPPIETVQEAIPSTDELTALFEKRQMLLNERSKYVDIQEKMKKKKLENGLLARQIEKLEEQVSNYKSQITNNNALLQHWQKAALAIAQNIKQQEDLILQSAIFKSTKPTSTSAVKPPSTTQFDYTNLIKLFEEHTRQILLSVLICPYNFYRKLHSYQTWFRTISTTITEFISEDDSYLLLRTRSFSTDNVEQYWKTCLQSYFLDINQILCPYELQGSCKAQNCIYQHQYQITQRIDQFLSSKNFSGKSKQKSLNQIDMVCSLAAFDLDLSILEKKINDKQYQRCRTKLDRYLSIYHEDFRYFRDPSSSQESQSIIHPILLRVSNQLDSDDFSLEHVVADLVEGLESQRTNAQLWCLYLEFSSWHMSTVELHHLCNAALKNAQSYDLFWTIFYLCADNVEELLSIYLNYIQSDEFDFRNRSFAICELVMFHGSLASNNDEAFDRIKNYLSNTHLNQEHRLYLLLVLIYTYAFGSFPRILYQQIENNRFEESIDVEPFLCPWYASMEYAHSHEELDRLWNDLMNPIELSESNFPLYINRFHYFNATKRFDQGKVYLETLIEAFPYSIELWLELLSTIEQSDMISETLDRARKSTGIYYEFVYSLSSRGDLSSWLADSSIPKKTLREKFFYELCQQSPDMLERKLDENLFRSNDEFQEITILEILFQFSKFSLNFQRKILNKILSNLVHFNEHQRMLLLYSFFRKFPIGRCLDILVDYGLSNNNDSYEWIIKPFSYRLLDVSISKDRNTLFWLRFDAFARQIIISHSSEEIYLILLQRYFICTEEKNKIARLCRLFEKHYPHGNFISVQLRQLATLPSI